jgi:hypothetical protein
MGGDQIGIKAQRTVDRGGGFRPVRGDCLDGIAERSHGLAALRPMAGAEAIGQFVGYKTSDTWLSRHVWCSK